MEKQKDKSAPEILTISLSGQLSEDAVITTDKRGNSYLRFRVLHTQSGSTDYDKVFFRCFTYNTNLSWMKAGTEVFVTGALIITKYKGNIYFDIHVNQITAI